MTDQARVQPGEVLKSPCDHSSCCLKPVRCEQVTAPDRVGDLVGRELLDAREFAAIEPSTCTAQPWAHMHRRHAQEDMQSSETCA